MKLSQPSACFTVSLVGGVFCERLLFACWLCFAGSQQVLDCLARLFPLASERLHHDWLNQGFYVFATCVLSPQLRARVGIKTALEERPKDRRVNRTPIKPRSGLDVFNFAGRKLQYRTLGEEIPVEVLDCLDSKIATVGHGVEQLLNQFAEVLRVS